MATLFSICILFGILRLSKAQSLPDCSSPSSTGLTASISLREDQPGQIVCNGLGTASLIWIGTGGIFTTEFTVSSCSTSGCTNPVPGVATATRNGTSSTLTFPNVTRNILQGVSVTCRTTQDVTCPIDVVYPAEVTESGCDVTVNTSGTGWTLQGTCDVTKVFSSRDRYHCQWYHRTPSSSSSSSITTVKSANTEVPGTSAKPYYTFTCTFSLAISQLTLGTHTLSVIVTPGGTATQITYQIVLPQPTHNCPTTWQKAGERLTCTCSADATGTPAALFRWQNTDTSQLDQVLTSNDDGQQLTCRALWGSDVKASVTYTLKVAYGPVSVNLSDPVTYDLDKVNLTCTASFVQPAPTFTWSGPCRGVTESTCSFTSDVTNNNDVINCSVTNVVTGISVASNSITLVVPAKPVLLLSSANPFVVNVAGSRAQVTLDFIAVPPPNSFTIQPFGSSSGNQSPSIPQDNIGSTCTAGGKSYLVTCNITIEGIIGEGNLYELGVYNTAGSTTVVVHVAHTNDTDDDVLPSRSESAQLSTGAAVGVAIAVILLIVIVVVVVIIIFLWRRRWVLPCQPGTTGVLSTPVQETVKTKTSAPASATGDYYELDDISQRQPTEPQEPTRQPHIPTPDNYSTLQLADIGVKSTYSEFTPYQYTPVSARTDPATQQQASSLDSDVYSN